MTHHMPAGYLPVCQRADGCNTPVSCSTLKGRCGDEVQFGLRGQPDHPERGGPSLSKRLGRMADAVVHAKTGPRGRFFTRECADEIALLLREAERFILEGR